MPEYCVTGGTGYIAAFLIKALLEKGHTVRTTARDPGDVEKVGFLWELNGAKERLKIYKADLMVENSFDEAIQGVDGVYHTASPVPIHCDDNVEAKLVGPCIKGTLNVMNSCSKATSVKRIVLTSSCSAIRYRYDVQQVSPLNESHWSDPEYCKRYNLWYAYSKTIGEKEAWRIAKEIGKDLVVVNPSCVVGPLLAPKPTSTLLLMLETIKGLRGDYLNTTVGFVHMDDVVAAHILAMEDSRASGRLICSSSVAHFSQIIEMLKPKYPSYPFVNKCGSHEGDNNPHSMDTSKIAQLGFPAFKPLDQMFDDCIKSFQDKGNVEKVGFLWELNGAKERLKIFKADLMVENSFDEAIQGVDGVYHTASPVPVSYEDNVQATLIDPCIKGTLNVMNSCSKATSVKRIVLTSSCSAIRYRYDVQQVSPLNESHWSDLEYCKHYNLWYAYSKTIGEKEAWRIAKEKGKDLVLVNPSFVVGPLLAPKPTSTLLFLLQIIKGLRGEFPNTTIGFVHIDDVVAAHILAMEDSRASGRLVCSSSAAHWSQIIEMLRPKYPSYPFENKCGSQEGDNNPHSMDTSKIAQLGFPAFKPLDQMFDDCIKSFQDKGFL